MKKKKIFIRSASEFSHESEKLNMDDSDVRDWDKLFQLTFLILKKVLLGWNKVSMMAGTKS